MPYDCRLRASMDTSTTSSADTPTAPPPWQIIFVPVVFFLLAIGIGKGILRCLVKKCQKWRKGKLVDGAAEDAAEDAAVDVEQELRPRKDKKGRISFLQTATSVGIRSRFLRSFPKRGVQAQVSRVSLAEMTPLHKAARSGDVASAQWLLSQGAWVDPHNQDDETPLYLAARCENDGVGLLLLKAKANKYHQPGKVPRTPSVIDPRKFSAVEPGMSSAAAAAEGGGGEGGAIVPTILDLVCRGGLLQCAKFIIEDMEIAYDQMSLSDQLKHEYPASSLIHACQNGQEEIVKLLTEASFARLKNLEERYRKPIGAIPAVIPDDQDESGFVLTTAMKEAVKHSSRIALLLFNLCCANVDDDDAIEKKKKARSFGRNDSESIKFKFRFRNDFIIATTQEESNLLHGGWRKKEDHPLWLLTQLARPELVMHPLVVGLIARKWGVVRRAYFFNFFSHMFLTILLAVLVVTLRPFGALECLEKSTAEWNCSVILRSVECRDEIRLASFSQSPAFANGSLRWASWFFVSLFMVMEFGQMAMRGHDYMVWRNLFDAVFLVSALSFVVDFNSSECPFHLQPTWQWNSGAVAIFLSFATTLLELRDFPSLGGSFVSMFLRVLETLVRVVLAVVLFALGFALAFLAILPYSDDFSDPIAASLKTASMTLGEIEFTELFDDTIRFRPAGDKAFAVAFFLVFCFCMPVAFMNLLVGLAVSDVGALKRDAKITELLSKLETILAWEYSLPNVRLRKIHLLAHLDLLSVKEAWPTYPETWSADAAIKEVGKEAFQPRGFSFFPNEGFFNSLKSRLRMQINSKLAKEMAEALNQQSRGDELKELLARVKEVKELLAKMPHST